MKFNRVVPVVYVCLTVLNCLCIGTSKSAVSFVNDVRVSMDIYENLVAMEEVTSDKIYDEFCEHGICLEDVSNCIFDLQSNLTSDILIDSYNRVPRIVFSMVKHSNDSNFQKVVSCMIGDSVEYGKELNHEGIRARCRATPTEVFCSLLDILKFDAEGNYSGFLSEYLYLSEVNSKDRAFNESLQSLLCEWSDKKVACMEQEMLDN